MMKSEKIEGKIRKGKNQKEETKHKTYTTKLKGRKSKFTPFIARID
jgi:hypothetical protein